MKKYFAFPVVLFVLLLSLSVISQVKDTVKFAKQDKTDVPLQSIYKDDFCEGFSGGFCEGYRYVKGNDVPCPTEPPCPIAKPGREQFKDGYNVGFLTGMSKAR